MASPFSSEPQDKFMEAENSINSLLEVPIRLLTDRKHAMLTEVATVREEYERNKADKESTIAELKASKEELECIASLMKANQAQGELEKAIKNLDSKINTIEAEAPKLPNIEFIHSSNDLLQLETLINSFGRVVCEQSSPKQMPTSCDSFVETKDAEIAENKPEQSDKTDVPLKSRDYATIKSPQTKLARFGKGEREFLEPAYMHIDENDGRIYVCDASNSRIQVLTLNGKYLSEFGKKHLVSPVGIAMCSGAIFITDFFKQTVFKFNHLDLSYVAKGRELGYPHGIDSEGEEIFVVEPFKHRVSVLTPELEHIRVLGVGVIKKCYGIRVRQGVMYASEYNTNTIKLLHSQTGELMRSIATNKDGESLFNATYFSMDLAGNFFLTDAVADQLKILSPGGEMLARVQFKGWKSHEPKGVAVTSDKKLFISFGEGENSILIL